MLSIPHRRTGKTEKAGDCSSTLFCPQGLPREGPLECVQWCDPGRDLEGETRGWPRGLGGEEGQPRSQDLGGGYRNLQGAEPEGKNQATPMSHSLSLKAPHCGSRKPHGLSSLCYWGGAPSSSGTYTLPMDSPPDGRRALTWVPHWPSPTHTALCGLPFHSTLIANPQTLLWKNVNT